MKLVEEPKDPKALAARTLLVLALVAVIASLHVLRVGRFLGDDLRVLHASYFSDVVVPLAAYFLLTPSEASFPPLRPWWVKAGLVFAAAAGAEILQGLGIEALGSTFDPADFLAYALGVLAAVLLDRLVLARWVPFWDPACRAGGREPAPGSSGVTRP